MGIACDICNGDVGSDPAGWKLCQSCFNRIRTLIARGVPTNSFPPEGKFQDRLPRVPWFSSVARRTIWLQFQDLLPRSLSETQRKILLDKLQDDGEMLNWIYDAAIYAGYLRGWAEGDGAHRTKAKAGDTAEAT